MFAVPVQNLLESQHDSFHSPSVKLHFRTCALPRLQNFERESSSWRDGRHWKGLVLRRREKQFLHRPDAGSLENPDHPSTMHRVYELKFSLPDRAQLTNKPDTRLTNQTAIQPTTQPPNHIPPPKQQINQ